MIEYECIVCERTFEIEEIEATLYPHNHEHYEHGLCKNCFEK